MKTMMRVTVTREFWQHITSGEVWAVETTGGSVTGCVGPLHQEEIQRSKLDEYEYADGANNGDAEWLEAQRSVFRVVEPVMYADLLDIDERQVDGVLYIITGAPEVYRITDEAAYRAWVAQEYGGDEADFTGSVDLREQPWAEWVEEVPEPLQTISAADAGEFTVPPADQGQTVEYAYAAYGDGQVLVRITDRSEWPGGTRYYLAEFADEGDRFEPWNTAPTLEPAEDWEEVRL